MEDSLKEAKDYIKEKYSYTDEKVKEMPLPTLLSLVEATKPEIYQRTKMALRKQGYII